MNYAFNFFYPIMTAFTTLCAVSFFGENPANDITTRRTQATVPHPPEGHPRWTRLSRPSARVEPASGQSVLRRSARLRQKYVVPSRKPILSAAPRRALRRQGAIVNLQQLEPTTAGNTTTTPTTTSTRRQLKREDSFILVDYGNHFRMVEPAYAMRYFHSVPVHIRTVAPYHALGVSVGEQELRARLLAVPIDPTIGTKRSRFVDGEDPGIVVVDDTRPRKRRRLT